MKYAIYNGIILEIRCCSVTQLPEGAKLVTPEFEEALALITTPDYAAVQALFDAL